MGYKHQPLFCKLLSGMGKWKSCMRRVVNIERPPERPLPPFLTRDRIPGKKFLSSCAIGKGCPLPVPTVIARRPLEGGYPP